MNSMQNSINQKVTQGWLYLLFSKPQMYFLTIIKHTIIIGLITLILCYMYFHSPYKIHKIPTITHTLISLAIGLLLVFRTQSAYERWYSAYQNFYNIKSYFNLMLFRLRSLNLTKESRKNIKKIVGDFCENFSSHLQEMDVDKALHFENLYLNNCSQLIEAFEKESRKNLEFDKSDSNFLIKIVGDILLSCSSCTRIRNTPIPISYEIHIKLSIFLYILSLPFGLFYDMGIWSVFMVMLVYYILAGIEIISKEIENPFEGSPNDLPVRNFMYKINNSFI